MTVRLFSFDRLSGIRVSLGLTWAFNRAIATIDPGGFEVAADAPRYDYWPTLMPTVPASYGSVGNPDGSSKFILASGVSGDGSDDIMVLLDPDHGNIITYHGGTLSNPNVTEYIDDTSGEVNFAPNPMTGQVFLPISGVVFHGAIILAGEVYSTAQDPYSRVGWGFVINQNLGHPDHWRFIWSDENFSFPQPTIPHGREWVLRVSPAWQRQGVPTQFWAVCVDYRHQITSPKPEGGRVYVIKFTRANALTDWAEQLSTGTSPHPFYKDLPKGDNITATGCHAHSAHLVEYQATGSQAQGVQVIVSLGDTQGHNRFDRLVFPDPAQDYTNDVNWTYTPNFHARRQVNTTLGSEGMQPVGVAFGPMESFNGNTRPTLIWGGDEQTDLLAKMLVPYGETPQQAQVNLLHGMATGFGSDFGDSNSYGRPRPLVFLMNQPRPETAGPLVTCLSHATSAGGAKINRVLYCPSTATPGKWMHVASVAVSPGQEGTAAIYGDGTGRTIYFHYGGANILSVPQPTDLTEFKPINVACGGKNLLVDGCYVGENDPNVTLTNVARESTYPWWHDLDTDSAFVPQPPSLGTKMFRFVCAPAGNGLIAKVHLTGTSSTQWDQSPAQWNAGVTQVRRVRAWVLNRSYGHVSPNKTLTLGMQAATANTLVDPPNKDLAAIVAATSEDRWCPATLISYMSLATTGGAPTGLGLFLRTNSSTLTPDDNRGYIVLDCALDGLGALPYPVPPWTNLGAAPPERPDEHLTVNMTGLSATGSWGVRVGGLLPMGNWNMYADRRTPDPPGEDDIRYWPLFTLWADDSNWIEFLANAVDRKFRVRLKAAGGSVQTYDADNPTGHANSQFWINDSPLYVGIGFTGSNDRLYVGASLGGGEVVLFKSGGNPWLPFDPSVDFVQLRFRGAPDTAAHPAHEVCEMRWMGGDTDDSNAWTDSSLPGAFTSLDFMKGPP